MAKASASAIRAGRAFIEVFADSTQLQRGLKQAEKSITAFGQQIVKIGAGFTAVGGAITAPLVAATRHFANVGDMLDKMAKRTGASVESLSALGFAAEQSGADITAVASGFKFMAKTIDDAIHVGGIAADTIERIGLSVTDLAALNPEQRFIALAEAISRLPDAGARAAAAIKVFGRGGDALLPLINEGGVGIQKLTDRFRALGLEVSTADAALGAQFTDNLNIVRKMSSNLVRLIGGALVPDLNKLAARVGDASLALTKFVRTNGELIKSVFKVGAVLTAAGVGMVAIGTGFVGLGAVLASATAIFATVKTAALGFAAALGVLASPPVLVAGGIGLLVASFVDLRAVAGSALNWLSRQFGELLSTVKLVVGGMVDALKGGDVSAAAEVLWASLKVTFAGGALSLQKIWNDAWSTMIHATASAMKAAARIVIDALATLRHAFASLSAFISKSWIGITSTIEKFAASARYQSELALVAAQRAARLISEQEATDRRKQAAGDFARSAFTIQAAADQSTAAVDAAVLAERHRIEALADASDASVKAYSDLVRSLAGGSLDSIREAEMDLLRAQRELNDALSRANEAGDVGAIGDNLSDNLSSLMSRIGAAVEGVAQTAAKLSTQGTFFGGNVLGLQAASNDRAQKRLDEISLNTKRIANSAADGGLTFA